MSGWIGHKLPDQDQGRANLSGKNEVPPVATSATGTAYFQLSTDGKQIDYELGTKDLANFIMANIHQGKAGATGPPVALLSMGKGKIVSTDLLGLSGRPLSDLVKIMEDGNAYVNVHTKQNPDGEIRGPIILTTKSTKQCTMNFEGFDATTVSRFRQSSDPRSIAGSVTSRLDAWFTHMDDGLDEPGPQNNLWFAGCWDWIQAHSGGAS